MKESLTFLADKGNANVGAIISLLENEVYEKEVLLKKWKEWDVDLLKKMQQQYVPNMIYVEGGTFQIGSKGGYLIQMGSNDGFFKDEKPIHAVELSNFYLGSTLYYLLAIWPLLFSDP